MTVEIAVEVSLDRPREIGGIARLAERAGPALHYILRQGADIRSDCREPEAISEKEDTALVNVFIRQNQDVRGLEVKLGLFIRYEVRPDEHPPPLDIVTDHLLDPVPIPLRAIRAS